MKPASSLLLIVVFGLSQARAEVRLPAVFSDHMVLQADKTVPVWGWAGAGEKVTVSIEGESQSVVTGADGKWRVNLESLKPAASAQELVVQGANRVTVKDVLVGEVWLCSGQSNMVLKVSAAKDYEKERAAAALPQIRMFTVVGTREETAKEDCQGAWVACSPESVGDFSAVAFFFGRELHQRLGGAVGLINSSAGGTLIESWLNLEAQQKCAELKPFFQEREKLLAAFDESAARNQHQVALTTWEAAIAAAHAAGKPPPARPGDPVASHLGVMNLGGLYNGMIAPLVPYALRGIAWYQGESNAHPDRARFYESQMRLLVTDWRARWGSELPFVWVQLPNLAKKMPWPEIREAQQRCLDLPQTGMAITIDVGEPRDVHPKDKQTVGHRLAQWALGTVYHQDVSAVSGPVVVAYENRGHEIVVRFQHANSGLVAKGGPLEGFVIAGENRAWKPAEARIEGESVVVSSPKVPQPVAVRYAWMPNPTCNLFNGAGLPASPFRTDDWETVPTP